MPFLPRSRTRQSLPPSRGKVARPKAVTDEGAAVRRTASPPRPLIRPLRGHLPPGGWKAFPCGGRGITPLSHASRDSSPTRGEPFFCGGWRITPPSAAWTASGRRCRGWTGGLPAGRPGWGRCPAARCPHRPPAGPGSAPAPPGPLRWGIW